MSGNFLLGLHEIIFGSYGHAINTSMIDLVGHGAVANELLVNQPVESKNRTYHWCVGMERTGGWPGGVGQDWMPTELFAQETSLPRTLQSIEDTSPCPPRSTNKRNPMQTDGGTKPAVDNRFIRRTRSPLCSWLLTRVSTSFCLCKPFTCKACPGMMFNMTCRIQNPDTPRAGRVGAAHGGATGQRGAG